LIAEKLPSLHPEVNGNAGAAAGADGTTPASDDPESQVGSVPGVPNSGLPRPKATVKPDRYTPGTVPPAADLRPGAQAAPQTQ